MNLELFNFHKKNGEYGPVYLAKDTFRNYNVVGIIHGNIRNAGVHIKTVRSTLTQS